MCVLLTKFLSIDPLIPFFPLNPVDFFLYHVIFRNTYDCNEARQVSGGLGKGAWLCL